MGSLNESTFANLACRDNCLKINKLYKKRIIILTGKYKNKPLVLKGKYPMRYKPAKKGGSNIVPSIKFGT